MRKITFLVFLAGLIILTGCKSGLTTSSSSTSEITTLEGTNINKIFTYISMKKEDVEKELGKEFEIVPSGAEGELEGYFYQSLNIVLTYNDDEKVDSIYCNGNVDLNGVKGHVSFDEIQKILGNSKIEKTWIETPDHVAYVLLYNYKDYQISFFRNEDENEAYGFEIYKR